MSFLKDDCYHTVNMHCFCIEFHFDKRRHGFHASQLIGYTLESNPAAADDEKNLPLEKLVFAFSTADVVVLGWRLGRLADNLRENRLAAVGVLPKGHTDFDRNKPFVASIAITPVTRG